MKRFLLAILFLAALAVAVFLALNRPGAQASPRACELVWGRRRSLLDRQAKVARRSLGAVPIWPLSG